MKSWRGQDKTEFVPEGYIVRRISLFLVAGVIAIAVYVSVNSMTTLTEQSETQTSSQLLDYDAYAEGINTLIYDAAGNVNYTLQAERQVHFLDDSTELQKPLIRLYEAGNSRWNIVANSGRISPLYTAPGAASESDSQPRDRQSSDIQLIELSGAIEVLRLDEFGNRMVMTTEVLQVDPHSRTMETDQPVTVVTDSLQITSAGMYADMNQNAVVFKNEVRGSYEIAPN